MITKKLLSILIGLVVGLSGLLGGGLAYSKTHPLIFSNPRATLISESELANKYGLQLTLTATTGMNSWIDVRFKILDAQKAQYILEDPERQPVLRVETGKHATVSSPSNKGAHHHMLETGKMVYLLFPNPQMQVSPGTPVRLIFGDLVLEPVLTQ